MIHATVGPASQWPVFSVVIPLFNEQEIVPELIRRVTGSCRSLEIPFQLVVVNDGSRDETLPCLIRLSRAVPELRVVSLARNFGHMAALSAGLAVARGDAVVVMDGDLQDPPELIPRFVAAWQAGAEVVYGKRVERGDPLPVRAATAAFYWLLGRIAETPIPRQVGTFGLMDRRIVDRLNSLPERSRYFAGLRAWVGGKQAFVTYERPGRRAGRSRVGLRGLLRLARTGIISFSRAPLRYGSLVSLLAGLSLVLVGGSALAMEVLAGRPVTEWAACAVIVGLMGFAQSLALAVLSEYVAVLLHEVKARPMFVIAEEFAGGEAIPPAEPSANHRLSDRHPAGARA